MSLMAADDRVIQVTTFEDQNGEDLNNCSLREALVAAKKNIAFGGCSAGNTNRGSTDYIQLKEGEYILNSELRPESMVRIYGAAALDYKQRDPLIHRYPSIAPLKTSINAQGNSRILNTSDTQASVALYDLVLKNGNANGGGNLNAKDQGKGGAVFVAGPLSANNIEIQNSKAEQGGAIYVVAHQTERQVNLENAFIHHNQAKVGSVLAMDCQANLVNTRSVIHVNRSSIIQNGATDSQSTFDLCGQPELKVSTSTIAQNQANANQGHIFNLVHSDQHPLSTLSQVSLESNTIVENQAFSTLFYDQHPRIALFFNVLAFNQGKSCRSAQDLNQQQLNIATLRNAILPASATAEQGECDLPETASSSYELSKNIDLTGLSFDQLLQPLQAPSAYNLFLPLYYPKRGVDPSKDLIDVEGFGCAEEDQRGLARVSNATLTLNPDAKNSCDIGAVEVMRLNAADITSLSNISYERLLDGYQEQIDRTQASIDQNKTSDQALLTQARADLKTLQDLLNHTKAKQQYRAIYIDPFALALKQDEPTADGQFVQLKQLNSENFSIQTEALGIGAVSGTGTTFNVDKLTQDPLFKCEWDTQLQRILMYRLNDKVTELTDSAYCKYTITSKSDSNHHSSGLLEGKFNNIQPIAKDDRIRMEYGSDLKVSFNPLANDSDGGDGIISTLTENTNKPAFYRDHTGQELAIRFTHIPSSVVLTADRKAPCPGDYARETCYGGNIQVQVRNSFSPFDYELRYTVFDHEQALSEEATITLENTAKNTNYEASSGGGGSLGIWGLMTLLGLVGYRRHTRFKS
ncbi:CSLREA domain-containing protein [Acinetobacter towneri]|uniref:CSLREA domain-containing protein n=1 Tax=Acinetobacter towneri TaxID=202956 RepID=UPI002DBDF63F|nr:CSLREA domain-containing protein [Acinetobacter towneri]MEB6563935.1 CSLREA domain-containing protein [Acinetobacter towneri]